MPSTRKTLVGLIWALAASLMPPGLAGAQGLAGVVTGGTAGSGAAPATVAAPAVPAGNAGAEVSSTTINNIDANAASDATADAAKPDADTGPGAGTLREPVIDNEFQRFVRNATGVSLPRFGQPFFGRGARQFSPQSGVPVPANYVLGPGDELTIRAWGSIDVNYRAVVDRNGQISIPKVGTFGVAGIKAGEIDAHIQRQVERMFRGFSLNVTLGKLRGIEVFVVGQALRPGSYSVSSLSTLVNVVFASGGPGPNGSMRQVQLKRGDKVVAELDLYDFIITGARANDPRLLPGDVIVYLPAGPQVALLGALDTPAVYEMKPAGETIDRLLAYGGGTRASTNLRSALLERIDSAEPKAPRTVINVDLALASSVALRDGDLLTLFGVAPQFANAVTLRGNVAAPLRYPHVPGMKISTLIPERDALITPGYYQRKNKLVQFTETRDVALGRLGNDVNNLLDEPNWEYAAIERLDTDRITLKLIPFNLGKAVIDRDPAHDLALLPGDVVTVFSRNDIRNPVGKQSRLVRVEGEVAAPGIYQANPGDSLHSVLQRAGGLTPQAYVFGLEFSRAATRQAQTAALADAVRRLEVQLASQAATLTANLSSSDSQGMAALQASQREARQAQLGRLKTLKPSGRIALELDTAAATLQDLPDVPLEDGDRITVPNKPGFVFAVGAVDNHNALLWRSGRQVKDYLTSAGVQPDADEGNIFVLRADGSVVQGGRQGFFSNIDGLVLMPGDTMVVPDKVMRETFWTALTRGLKDWTQILYQLGLTAAAIQTLQ